MRCLNQPIARQANLEDGCTGKFWESRFTSQALKTEEALLSCMAYVDLNPIRAEMASTPEDSDHTSIQERLSPRFDLNAAIKSQYDNGDLLDYKTELKPLSYFEGKSRNQHQSGILFSWKDYLELVDSTGRIIQANKRGYIENQLPPILERLQVSAEQWLINSSQFETIHARRFNRITPNLDTG